MLTKVDGIYYDSLTSNSGCDSINITALIIKPEIITGHNWIGAGDSLFVGGAFSIIQEYMRIH